MSTILGLAALLLTASPSPAVPPVAVFADLDGTWEGEFAGYDTEGRELYRISVRQTYRTLDEETQQVEITDTQRDGSVITGRGKNTARRRPDGSLELECVVVKSNGERVVHQGRLGTAPDGGEQLVWFSRGEDRVETFRETVRGLGDGAVYSIDGVGRYGETVILMGGRYRRIEPEAAPAPEAAP